MFSLRRFLATLLIVMVLSAGFGLLPNPFVQKADACGSSCEEAIQQCENMAFWAYVACTILGDDDPECKRADRIASFWCAEMVEVCDPSYEGEPN